MAHSVLHNKVQLITYPDSLGKNLKGLRHVLETHVTDAIGGVHILPFYPSSADRGYAPLTHLTVDSHFGTWADIRAISDQYDLVADLSVNHLSCESPYFKDYLEKGEQSKYASVFLNIDTFLERHGVAIDSLRETYRPRPSLPFTAFRFKDGITRKLWTTFTNHQVDLDLTSPVTRTLMTRFIQRLVENGVRLIRLDAVGYTIKKPWTTSFLIPETYEFMRWIRETVPASVEVLAEVHHDYRKQEELLASKVTDWVYDFSLPLLTLNALYTHNAATLKHWITIRSPRQITTLDTHDGIGVVDVEGLMPPEAITSTLETLMHFGGNHLYRASGKHSQNVDIYQVNSTYYSALGEQDDAYVAARAIQFFVPGIPQVYYVGLFAGANDFALFEETNHGRDINRHNYTLAEVDEAVTRPVVQRLLRLMRFRGSHPAFGGAFTLLSSDDNTLRMRWQHDDLYAELHLHLPSYRAEVEYLNPQTGAVESRIF